MRPLPNRDNEHPVKRKKPKQKNQNEKMSARGTRQMCRQKKFIKNNFVTLSGRKNCTKNPQKIIELIMCALCAFPPVRFNPIACCHF